MKIVITGAGAVGFHLAELLAKENQDIIIIDTDESILQHASTHLDVLTVKGDVTSISVLKEVEIHNIKLFIAVTTSETTNLFACILAKQLGAKRTIARVNNPEYFEAAQLEYFKKLGVEKLFSPQLLAAAEVDRLLERCAVTDIFEFENGKISIAGFTIESHSQWIGQSIENMRKENQSFDFKVIALLRHHKTIIPRATTVLQKGDHLYFATTQQNINKIATLEKQPTKKIKQLMIIGTTNVALKAAQLLEKKYHVTLVVNDKNLGKRFLEQLDNTLIVHSNFSNIENLKEEGLAQMDAFIALTENSEINIISSLMAEQLGVFKTIALVDNVNYIHLSQAIGIDTLINKKLIAANEIFQFVRKGNVAAIASLHGVEAEVIEYVIHRKNQLLRHPIKKLHFPKQTIIAGVIRGQKSIIPDGDFHFQLNDKVIVFALPETIPQLEKMFK